MGITRSLGGNRLGSGNKMEVDMHGYERSTFDLSYIWRSTMSCGTLVPFLKEVALPGDTFDINLDAYVNTHPTIGPLFGSFKLQMDVFQAPIRLYQGQLHNNKLGIGMNMSKIKLPLITLTDSEFPPFDINYLAGSPDMDNIQINPSCILSYLGIRGVGCRIIGDPQNERKLNAIPLLAYWEIYKNYYSNKQENIGYVIHKAPASILFTIVTLNAHIGGASAGIPQSPTSIQYNFGDSDYITGTFTGTTFNPDQIQLYTLVGWKKMSELFNNIEVTSSTSFLAKQPNWATFGGTNAIFMWDYVPTGSIDQTGPPKLVQFTLTDIDKMRERILAFSDTVATPFDVNGQNIYPYNYVLEDLGDYRARLANQEGLGIKTYNSDMLNNWIETEWIDGAEGISAITAIDTSGGSFNIDTLNLAKKVYNMLNRIAISGGTYDDWLDVTYDHPRMTRAESPIYHGSLIKEIVFEEVISQAGQTNNNTGDEEPLGTLAGKGKLSPKHKGGHITVKVDEPSYIMGIVSITPRIDYSQGNKWDIDLETMDDFHKPALDEIGFQELVTERMAWWSTYWDGGVKKIWSAGKQPAWINYMSNVNEIRGNFAIRDNQMFMVLTRRYEFGPSLTGIEDLTTYIDPTKFNYIFAQTSLDAQNYWVQIGIDMKVRRKMSAKLMPNV